MAAESAPEHAERRTQLADCIGRLGDDARTILRLRCEENLERAEIARRLGKTYAAVRKMLSRARAFLVRCTGRRLAVEAE